MDEMVDSAGDDRTANNTLRHKYRVLSDAEKAQMQAVKDKGAEFLNLLDTLKTPPETVKLSEVSGDVLTLIEHDRELDIARERIEEAVMWAVKHITR